MWRHRPVAARSPPRTLPRPRRFGLAFGGAYAEYIAVNEGMVTKKPEGVSWVQAAAVCENWLTA
jgi:NADPH:quinone reductase-like Zn-dependent oxidoreductase